jgi:Fe-S-cluster containining protein
MSNREEYFDIHKLIDHFVLEYKKAKKETNGISAANSFNNLVDELIDEQRSTWIKDGNNVTCGKFCSYCCKTVVHVSDDEAALVLDLAKKNNHIIDRDKLKRQVEVGYDWEKLPWKDRGCIFLDEKENCSIYERRPTACRKLFSCEDPKKCDTRVDGVVKRPTSVHAEIVASATMNATKTGSMAEMISQLL